MGDILCSALRWASADVSLVFLWKKLSEKRPIFWRQSRNHFFVSANFAYFFSFWPSQGVTPGRIQSRQIHLAGNPGSFFACKLKKFFVYWHLSVIPASNFSFFLGLPSMKVSSFLDKTVCRHTGVPQRAFCYRKVAFFYFFCGWSWNVLFSIHLKLLKWSNFETIWIWTSKCTFKIVWCYHCFNRLTWYSGAC